ncbi:MAG: M23 family metallopeptidase [Rickettsiales bacterium]|nr:M23 family metallopeptidase [Rickettsiales bacterium]
MRANRRKGFKYYFRKVFHRRNLIVMSDESVDHYPVAGATQFLLLALVVGGFSWVSYSTGSYMTAQHVLEEKDRQLVSTTLQKRKIGEEYSLLKHDLKKLKEAKGDLSKYAKFVLDQHSQEDELKVDDSTIMDAERLGEMKSRLMERISFLEDNLLKLQQENEDIVTTVMERTQDKIKELRDVVKRTGLEASTLTRKAKKEIARTQSEAYKNQGGPYLPDTVQDLAPNLIENIDEALALQHLVERLPLGKPVASARTTSRFGRRYDPFTHRPAVHSGQDFVGKKGARVVATANGRVVSAERRGAYGKMVVVDHGFGITTRYAHLSKLAVHKGQRVKKGQRLGNQGTTGRSTGEHLHYEVRYNKTAVNPMKFIKAGSYVR